MTLYQKSYVVLVKVNDTKPLIKKKKTILSTQA